MRSSIIPLRILQSFSECVIPRHMVHAVRTTFLCKLIVCPSCLNFLFEFRYLTHFLKRFGAGAESPQRVYQASELPARDNLVREFEAKMKHFRDFLMGRYFPFESVNIIRIFILTLQPIEAVLCISYTVCGRGSIMDVCSNVQKGGW